MNEIKREDILSPAENARLTDYAGFVCEFVETGFYCGKRGARRINKETYRCSDHLPIAFNS